jgi:ribose 1,5-bisphosphokinase
LGPTRAGIPRHQGAIVLVAGPSGAGKDTVIAFARARLADNPRFAFARRLITRKVDGIEQHEACSDATFLAAEAAGDLALSWRAHGIAYGIRRSTVDEVERGRIVVANVVPAGLALTPRALVVYLTASPSVLARRLEQRGRETAADITARLAREAPLLDVTASVVTINNDGPIEQAGGAFLRAILKLGETSQKRHAGDDAEPRA